MKLNINKSGSIEMCGMTFHAFHGCREEEKRDGNTFTVDFKGVRELRHSAESDILEHTSDCSAIYDVIAQEMSVPSDLLENVCGRIVHALHSSFKELSFIRVTVSKKNPPLSGPCECSKVTLQYRSPAYRLTSFFNIHDNII